MVVKIFCSDCGAVQPQVVDEGETQAEETLPAVMGAKSWKRVERVAKTRVAGERMLDTLHRAVETATGGAKFLGRVADEDDATVVCREEQFKCCLPGDATVIDETMDDRFDIDDDESAVIVGIDVGNDVGIADGVVGDFFTKNKIKKIIIPDTIEDMSVVGIADSVFRNFSALETVTLPDSIVAIGTSAFDSCTSLKSINLPKSLSEIGDYAFQDCSALKQVIDTSGLNACITFENDDDSQAFEGCSSLSLKSQSLLRKAGYTGSF